MYIRTVSQRIFLFFLSSFFLSFFFFMLLAKNPLSLLAVKSLQYIVCLSIFSYTSLLLVWCALSQLVFLFQLFSTCWNVVWYQRTAATLSHITTPFFWYSILPLNLTRSDDDILLDFLIQNAREKNASPVWSPFEDGNRSRHSWTLGTHRCNSIVFALLRSFF